MVLEVWEYHIFVIVRASSCCWRTRHKTYLFLFFWHGELVHECYVKVYLCCVPVVWKLLRDGPWVDTVMITLYIYTCVSYLYESSLCMCECNVYDVLIFDASILTIEELFSMRYSWEKSMEPLIWLGVRIHFSQWNLKYTSHKKSKRWV